MSCEHACRRPPWFPLPIHNRPGLSEIGYRIGTYASLRGHMLARLDHQTPLAAWTHRTADDPAIALLEAAALVGDILTFYQSLYANEAYLRTARWRESVADLVRLLGYRLAPGVGGRALFALAAKGNRPITIPAGSAFKTQLEGEDKPAVFETEQVLTAYPHLSRFRLYRPRRVPNVANGMRELCVSGALPEGLDLKAGDRILVGVSRQLASGGEVLDGSQVLIVDDTWEAFGLRHVRMKGALTSLGSPASIGASTGPLANVVAQAITQPGSSSAQFSLLQGVLGGGITVQVGQGLSNSAQAMSMTTVAAGLVSILPGLVFSAAQLKAFKLSGSFRHFGHNAPPTQISVNANGRARETAVNFVRALSQSQGAPADPSLASVALPLDGEYDSVTAGTRAVIEASLSASSSRSSPARYALVRSVQRAQKQTRAWGPMSGGSTLLSLDRNLALQEGSTSYDYADIRGITVHAVEGQPFLLEAAPVPTLSRSGTELDFFGTAEEAKGLEKRAVLLAYPEGTLKPARINAVNAGAASEAALAKLRRVTLDTMVSYSDFGHGDPKVEVFGNLIEATQGKTEDEAVLGDGDGQQAFQTFPLPKAPLTYLLDPAQTPSHVAELDVYVDGVKWQRAETFFSSGPNDRVYVVREDDKGKSYVQFGDGKTGARLPSGSGNVVAIYRTGIGAQGPLKADAKPQPAGNLPGLDQATMLGPATGGAQPEGEEGARTAAPGRMQSLGRLVGLADYEAEALAIPGVIKARAVWAAPEGTPLIRVTLLTESRSATDANAVAQVLQSVHAAQGPARWPLIAVPGGRRQVQLSLTVGYRAELREADVRKAVLEALGATGEEVNGSLATHGLFSWQLRQFGHSAHGSQVLAAVQNAPGVVWVELGSLGVFGMGAPTMIAGLLVPPAQRTLPCPDHLILALKVRDVTLNLSKGEA
jgi:hypothetical protein